MQIVIPMAGSGERYAKEGYTEIKPLIKIENKTMIEHVIENFPINSEFIFICNEEHLKNTALKKILLKKTIKSKIVPIMPHNLGPAYSVMAAAGQIEDKKAVIVNYCDFKTDWDYKEFERQLDQTNCDGALTAYTGFHPHLLWSNKYAGMKVKNNWLTDIKEKHSFSSNPMDSYHSAGTYYFKTGKEMKKYVKEIIEKKMSTNNEYYVSTAFELMLLDRKKVFVYELKHFLQWGTPQDLKEYLYWASYFTSGKGHAGKFVDKTTILMPMAGEGKRFIEAGYLTPKPLIEVSGKPMFEHSIKSYPKASEYVFVCSKDHLKHKVDKKILQAIPNAKIVVAEKLTQGQASSCLLAENVVDPNSSLLIIACDNKILFNEKKFFELINDKKTEALVWTFRNNVAVKRNPQAYAYVKTSGENAVFVSCKKTISDNPLNDHTVTGSFYFKKAGDFFAAAKEMIVKNLRVNNEFYADTVPNEFIEKGKSVKVFEVDNYIVYGTPQDLKTYEYWEEYFKEKK